MKKILEKSGNFVRGKSGNPVNTIHAFGSFCQICKIIGGSMSYARNESLGDFYSSLNVFSKVYRTLYFNSCICRKFS